MRIGNGFDVHPLITLEEYQKKYPDRSQTRLILGGIEIEHSHLLAGHSDADVLIHALIDALLGASGLGDIGELFPDTDNKYYGIASTLLLEQTLNLISSHNFKIGNIDLTILAEKPKISPYKIKIKNKLAELLKININQINLKATTTEKLGFVGREEGIAVMAVALLVQ
jgi:2-C-methyl-D-erythritol 2,4-cyclodiphosphate synthase